MRRTCEECGEEVEAKSRPALVSALLDHYSVHHPGLYGDRDD